MKADGKATLLDADLDLYSVSYADNQDTILIRLNIVRP